MLKALQYEETHKARLYEKLAPINKKWNLKGTWTQAQKRFGRFEKQTPGPKWNVFYFVNHEPIFIRWIDIPTKFC